MTDDHHFNDDDLPWAPPEVQMNYEAALGRFILVYNSIDNHLSELIETILKRLGRDNDLIRRCQRQDFGHKLLTLDLLKSSQAGDGISGVSIKNVIDINRHRNNLAHGHYDYSYNAFFDGNYYLVNINKDKKHTYSVQELNDLIQKADDVLSDLRYAEAFYDFSDDFGNDEDHPVNS